MIRERREMDLAPLGRLLADLAQAAGVASDAGRMAWLDEADVLASWVFDSAPVTVVPSSNVVVVRPGSYQDGIRPFHRQRGEAAR